MIYRNDSPTSLRLRIRKFYRYRRDMLRTAAEIAGRPKPRNVHPRGIASSISSMVDAIREMEGTERKGRNRWTVR